MYIKLFPDTFDLPCGGDNGLVIQDKSQKSVKFCGGTKIPPFVSNDVKFEVFFSYTSTIGHVSYLFSGIY